MQQSFKPLVNISNEVRNALACSMKSLQPFSESITYISKAIAESVGSTQKIFQAMTPAFERISKIQKDLAASIQQVSKVWNGIDWEKWVEHAQQWGKYGWTMIGFESVSVLFKFYKEIPENQLNADKKALKYINKDGLEQLFYELSQYKINKQDLLSAIFCFENKQYKACAMLLCAMIEAPLIRIQTNGNASRRAVGKGAIRAFRQNEMCTKNLDEGRLEYLHTENTFNFLYILFSDGNDFKNEPPNLNRNFINHGMSKRVVRRKDCIKLFLGLYNVLEMVEL